MRNSKLLTAGAALTLFVGGFLIANANKKNGVSSGIVIGPYGANGVTISNMSMSHFTTVALNGRLVYLSTSGGAKLGTVHTGSGIPWLSKLVYYKLSY
jgi:hypothetical protein